ncbi:hypothetical protein [Dactylosporangium darangshiense]|uniref:hypothetical protein n=1 Tax=Dactylosporangium darangshiense TaxID=579108 RepID=UPI0031EF5FB4
MWAEIHVFRGRMYATGQWGFSAGVHVADGASDQVLGATVLEQLQQRSRPPLPIRSKEPNPWHAFCERVAGVPVRQYRPEKRVRALRTDEGWQVDRRPGDMDAPVRIVDPADGLAALGAAVRRELASMEPRWPTVRRVMIMTAATGQVVVMPNVDGYCVGPARVVEAAAALHDAVLGALGDAEPGGGPAFEAALTAAGLDPRLLHGGARIILDERSDGSVELIGSGVEGNAGTPARRWLGRVDALGEVCAAAEAMLRELPAQHLPPGTHTGASFGFKCCWLAVRGGSTDVVTAAVGLRGAREVGWDEGVDLAYDRQVFVSPPIAGWVFVAGNLLPFDGGAAAGLSARLGAEVQFFGTHRVAEYHEWALATGGRLLRRLRCDGSRGEFEQQGAPTPVEAELGIPAMSAEDWDVNEITVMRVAAAWSLDPNTLHLRESSAPTGLAGTVPG